MRLTYVHKTQYVLHTEDTMRLRAYICTEDTMRKTYVDPMLIHRLRQWLNIGSTYFACLCCGNKKQGLLQAF